MQTPDFKFRSWYISEPSLLFGSNERSVDPKTGILTFGPYFFPGQSGPTPSEIRLGIIGDGETIGLAKNWLELCKAIVQSKKTNTYLFPSFGGFTKESTFRCEFIISESLIETITQNEVSKIIEIPDVNQRISKAADLFTTKVKILSQREPTPQVIICALPKLIDEYCGISKRTRGAKRPKFTELEKKINEFMQSGQKFLSDFDIGTPPIVESKGYDLRRAIKGRTMQYGIPVQIMRYRTLIGEQGLEDEATRAWNFSLGIYYKAGGFPWRLADFDPNTCYVGISFYRDKHTAENNLLTSVAQIFTSYGDGLVLRGEQAEIDKRDRQPHLTEDAAFKLLSKSIELYETQTKHKPSRVVVHKTSKYNEVEMKGFQKAAESIGQVTLVGFGFRDIRFFRNGKYPPLRGTLIQLPDKSLVLYTGGYIPYLKTYPGWRIPEPLEILQIIGNDDPTKVSQEILSLTKMNWNSARFSTKSPITIAFATEVGKILSELPNDALIQQHYKFYM